MENLKWVVTALNAPRLERKCSRCGNPYFVNSGCFRVNANGRNIDVWLIYKCAQCEYTWNLTVLTRVPPQSIPRELYDRFAANDEQLALQYGTSAEFISANRAKADMADCQLEIEGPLPQPGIEYSLAIEPHPNGLDVSLARIISQKLNASMSAVKRMSTTGEIVSDGDLRKLRLTQERLLTVNLKPESL